MRATAHPHDEGLCLPSAPGKADDWQGRGLVSSAVCVAEHASARGCDERLVAVLQCFRDDGDDSELDLQSPCLHTRSTLPISECTHSNYCSQMQRIAMACLSLAQAMRRLSTAA